MITLESYFKSPFRCALTIVLTLILVNIATYLVLRSFAFKYVTPIVVGISAYYLGALYGGIFQKTPTIGFKKLLALYYLILSRAWFVVLSVVFVDYYYNLVFDKIELITLATYSVSALIITYMLVYYGFNLGARNYLKSREIQYSTTANLPTN